jgi:transposase
VRDGNFYKRFLLLLMLHDEKENEADQLARSLASEMDSLWVFLDENGVEPTNNRAERALRFGVIWRKRCFGCQSDKGARWAERILSLKEPVVLKAGPLSLYWSIWCRPYFKEQQPNLAWIG